MRRLLQKGKSAVSSVSLCSGAGVIGVSGAHPEMAVFILAFEQTNAHFKSSINTLEKPFLFCSLRSEILTDVIG